jgi:hypothetical protein
VRNQKSEIKNQKATGEVSFNIGRKVEMKVDYA